jgi:hypothetical protein
MKRFLFSVLNTGLQRAEISEPSEAGSSEGDVSASVKKETKPIKQEKNVKAKAEEEPLMVETEKEDEDGDDEVVGEDEFVLHTPEVGSGSLTKSADMSSRKSQII